AMELLLGDDFHKSAAPVEPTGAEALVEHIALLIENNFVYRHFDLNYIANELGKHPNYLNSVFSGVRGIGLGEAIRLRRIEHAKELLAGSNDRIKDIFDQCGFARQNYFACAFRRDTGMTPLEYRKKFRGGGEKDRHRQNEV
ncbi:MAG: helix-turn-helix transcriptional regulator, partial [Victivallaceae bacterium]